MPSQPNKVTQSGQSTQVPENSIHSAGQVTVYDYDGAGGWSEQSVDIYATQKDDDSSPPTDGGVPRELMLAAYNQHVATRENGRSRIGSARVDVILPDLDAKLEEIRKRKAASLASR